ncbi:MAG: hypothetical protein KF696_07550 [Planctomycetes bacterium]|nr:hypothetical protein [Planctomycetota bacterium]MCW8135406.1 hypothetical protein [Planctomycetota bacterium]
MKKTVLVSRAMAVGALLCLVGGFGVTQSNEEWGPAKIAYDDYIKRPSLQMRTRGRVKLAQTQHPGAWDILTKSYAKPEAPKDHVKYLLTSIVARHFQDEQWTDKWVAWREANKAPEDAWLWYRGLVLHQQNRGEDDLLACASNDKNPLWLRAAALEALAENGSEKVLQWWLTKLDEAPKWKDVERAVWIECCTHNFWKESHSLGRPDEAGNVYRNVGLKLIPLIDNKLTNERTSLVMARYLREIFAIEHLYVNAQPWLDLLLNPKKEVERDSKYKPAAPPTKFVGIETHGKRIVYVIDMSDSMCIPFTGKEKEEIKKPPPPKGPVTGRGADGGKGKEEEKKEEEKKKGLEDDLPWDKIAIRWDVVREYLKLSLRGLQEDQFFCVIWFGTEAGTLKTTKGLVPATKANVEAAVREVDSIKKGAATQDRKHGTLRGNTNLHGGLHRAYKVKKNGMGKEYEYVDPTTWFDGADTIFVLTDGDPTDDDWAIVDKRDPWDQTGDPETRVKHADQEFLRFPGPYGYWVPATQGEWILDDARRLNLFRKCEIHTIGIGVGGEGFRDLTGLLPGLAKIGRGECKLVGTGE